MRPINIKVYYLSDEATIKSKAGIEYSLNECEIRIIRFYQISAVTPYIDEASRKILGRLLTNGDAFLTPHSYKALVSIVDEAHGIVNFDNEGKQI